ncbi:MAG: substrate-binding domain-containing protein [Alphaproteobacteria bacterium]|nr:substrate-binding domain-containing protein [Alphaproteobacteria bacterium]MBU1515191.1 substrate-binding domain-containing protein [Alphaproteobacteria bacterium]MBU2092321.1 substrate-binding domain-containing protein [Alphaproteobacteria bacterium]MBU2152915.1 substrate-binding domain-containing protein [Alphaproteobacteria bacterium]MBU2305746.1 substrate-binding domain-containing protein [Alphaproteobacteria bacterium]
MIDRRTFGLALGSGVAGLALAGCSRPAGGAARWRLGFSQVTTTEPWRVLFSREMRETAAAHPDLQLTIADGQDRTEKQVADVEAFVRQRVDLILVSPKESAGLTGAVEAATAAGIPVIVLDRGVDTEAYRQFIGSDNLKIGRMAGDYAVGLLGGKGKAQGRIVEIWGGMASTPAQERHKGFAAAADAEPGLVRVMDRQDADWKQDRAYNIMASALKAHPKIDLVYAHNDPMAYGAYLAAMDAGRQGEIRFIGIDGIPTEGAKWVKDGALTATFVYEPPGAEAIEQALRILKGEAVPKRIELGTQVIDATTVDAFLAKHA